MSLSALGKVVHRETDQRFMVSRLYLGLREIYEKKGGVYALSLGLSCVAVKVSSLAIAVFCSEGVVRSYLESAKEEGILHKIRPIGDAGGWTALTIFCFMTLGKFISWTACEGEYLRLESIFNKWIVKHKAQIEENPRFSEQLYKNLHLIYDVYSENALFSKNLASRKVDVLTCIENSGLDLNEKKYLLDKQLKGKLDSISKKIEDKPCVQGYFHRLYEGGRSIKKQGCCNFSSALIMGIALPILLLSSAALSFVGEVGLGNQLYIERNSTEEVGHFGEWPFNGIEVLGIAFLLHLWVFINVGFFKDTRRAYKEELATLEDNAKLYKRMAGIANKQLDEGSRVCQMMRLPADDRFDIVPIKLENIMEL